MCPLTRFEERLLPPSNLTVRRTVRSVPDRFCKIHTNTTARLTVVRPELDEQEQRAINERLAYIAGHIPEQPEIRIKYFFPDEHKSGGAIVVTSGKVKKISDTDGTIVLTDGCKIRVSDITDLSIG